MNKLTGEYECKIDSKGRVRLPASLIRQIHEFELGFTLNRGFERHLILYPKNVWDMKTEEIDRLNIYNKKQREAIRYFYRGATQLTLDGSDRFIIPKRLMNYAEIESEVILFAYQYQIEIWATKKYEEMIGQEPEDFSAIADELFDFSTPPANI